MPKGGQYNSLKDRFGPGQLLGSFSPHGWSGTRFRTSGGEPPSVDDLSSKVDTGFFLQHFLHDAESSPEKQKGTVKNGT